MMGYIIGLIAGIMATLSIVVGFPDEEVKIEEVVIAEMKTAEYCYQPYGSAVQPEYQAQQSTVLVTWLNQARAETVESEWMYDPTENISICRVWIRMPAQILGDPDMDAVGHEFLHCLIGDFHPEDE